MIRNATKDNRISWWEEIRGSHRDVLLWLEQEDYLVVLSKRKGYHLLKTAYIANKPHKKRGDSEKTETNTGPKKTEAAQWTASNAPSTHGR